MKKNEFKDLMNTLTGKALFNYDKEIPEDATLLFYTLNPNAEPCATEKIFKNKIYKCTRIKGHKGNHVAVGVVRDKASLKQEIMLKW